MTDNFLPKYQRPVTHGHKKTLWCQIRKKEVSATPEEMVRQRVLHWLIHDKNWPKDNLAVENPYKLVGDPDRTRIRPDIELLVDDKVTVVIECKSHNVPLDDSVHEQAKKYALKSTAEWIWATNGDKHSFLKLQKNGKWQRVEELELLGALAPPPPPEKTDIPDNVNSRADFIDYLEEFNDIQLQEADKYLDSNERRFVMAVHRVLFGVEKKLPYSHDGVEILKDLGSSERHFPNASGGRFHTRYAEFKAATSGRVEAVSLAVNPNYINDEYAGLRLCAGVHEAKT